MYLEPWQTSKMERCAITKRSILDAWKSSENALLISENGNNTQNQKLTMWKIPYFHLISCCGNFVENCSFRIVSGESPENMRELSFSKNCPHQEIRWNYRILSQCYALSLGECDRWDLLMSLHKISRKTDFLWPVLSRIKTESTYTGKCGSE